MDDQTRKNIAIALGVASLAAIGYYAFGRSAHAALPEETVSQDIPSYNAEAKNAWKQQQIAKRRADEVEAASRGITAYQVEQERLRREYQQRLQAANV